LAPHIYPFYQNAAKKLPILPKSPRAKKKFSGK
jgi:hypothetical protein